MKTTTPTDKPFNTIIGIDLGDSKHAVCITDQRGNIIKEYSIANTRGQIQKITEIYPDSLIAIEVGTHSPWISRLLQDQEVFTIFANARKSIKIRGGIALPTL